MDRKFAFCESSTNPPTGADHIRVLGPEGQLLGGGVKGPTLCGREWPNGWDLGTPVDAQAVKHPSTCPACAAAFDTY